jgi:hypothetical protein
MCRKTNNSHSFKLCKANPLMLVKMKERTIALLLRDDGYWITFQDDQGKQIFKNLYTDHLGIASVIKDSLVHNALLNEEEFPINNY